MAQVKTKRATSGITSRDVNHTHTYQVDNNGNGWANFAIHPTIPNVKHRHKIVNWNVQMAQSAEAPPHKHTLPLQSSLNNLNQNKVERKQPRRNTRRATPPAINNNGRRAPQPPRRGGRGGMGGGY